MLFLFSTGIIYLPAKSCCRHLSTPRHRCLSRNTCGQSSNHKLFQSSTTTSISVFVRLFPGSSPYFFYSIVVLSSLYDQTALCSLTEFVTGASLEPYRLALYSNFHCEFPCILNFVYNIEITFFFFFFLLYTFYIAFKSQSSV